MSGCAGRVMKMLKFPDNTVRVLVEGLRRFRIKEFGVANSLPHRESRNLKDVVEDSVELAALDAQCRAEFPGDRQTVADAV